MSSDTVMQVRTPGKWAAYLDLLQMLSGVGLILFMFSHVAFTSTIFLGVPVFDKLAQIFEETYMAQIGGPAVGVLFLVHFVLAARKIPFRLKEQRVIWQHARMLRHADTWLWIVQVVTAMIVLILGSIHMWSILTDLPITVAKGAAELRHLPWILFYIVFIPAIWLHLIVGFYRIGVKWGFIKKKTRKIFKTIEVVLMIVMITIGTLTLIRFLTLSTS